MFWKPPRNLAGIWVGVSLVAFPLAYVLVYMATGRFPTGGPLSGGRFGGLNDVLRDLQRYLFQGAEAHHE